METRKILKNIALDTPLILKDEVQVMPGQVVSKTLVQNEGVGITLFAFDKGEEISTHGSSGDALVYLLEGEGEFTVGGKKRKLTEGECLVMPADIPHAVFAPAAFKMLLVVVFPQKGTS
ncbi:cupin domain-containing protein [Ruminococcaceae bacterium OttesenSCG-928-I18]|nr:cupin domain-containing protein [Ruminococcaceae bacterium OttesenSCG-928-I18]